MSVMAKFDSKMPKQFSQLEMSMVAMFEMQHDLNKKIHPKWWDQGFKFHRAAWIECAELMDKIGWKWWSKQERDVAQLRMELVDIWHFLMSALMLSSPLGHSGASTRIHSAASYWAVHLWHHRLANGMIRSPERHLKTQVDKLAELLASNSTTESFTAFVSLVLTPGTGIKSWQELHALYIGKNVLNQFRQDKGYKEGTYPTVWPDGKEDNEHLAELIETLSGREFDSDYSSEVRKRLDVRFGLQEHRKN